jgi:hypothetical protein
MDLDLRKLLGSQQLMVGPGLSEGMSQGGAARRCGVSPGWVSRLLARYRDEGDAA